MNRESLERLRESLKITGMSYEKIVRHLVAVKLTL